MEIVDIIKSKLRKQLLRHYFLNPEGRYYLRELERLLKVPVGNLRRELRKLKVLGLFASQKVGNLVYYYLNKKYPLYYELRNIVLKTIGLGDVFREKLSRLKGIDFAFIYGSFASGAEVKASDIDLMIIGRVCQARLISVIHEIEDRVGRRVIPVVYSPDEFRKRIQKKNPFVMNVMRNKKIMIIGDENELQRIGR